MPYSYVAGYLRGLNLLRMSLMYHELFIFTHDRHHYFAASICWCLMIKVSASKRS